MNAAAVSGRMNAAVGLYGGGVARNLAVGGLGEDAFLGAAAVGVATGGQDDGDGGESGGAFHQISEIRHGRSL